MNFIRKYKSNLIFWSLIVLNVIIVLAMYTIED